MPTFCTMVVARASALLPSAHPGALALQEAWSRGGLGSSWGAWVGPQARIVRRAHLDQPATTTISQPWGWANLAEAPQTDQGRAALLDLLDQLREHVTDALARVEPAMEWSVEVVAYDPVAHGELSDWRSSAASRTETRDTWHVLRDLTDAEPEFPPPRESPGGLLGPAKTLLREATPLLVTLTVITVGVAVVPRLLGALASALAAPRPQPRPAPEG